VYASKWDGTRWISLGGALNSDTAEGSAVHPSIAIVENIPVIAWGEVKQGGMRQIFVRQWDGAEWTVKPVPHPLGASKPLR
jgi:hypothetical protein